LNQIPFDIILKLNEAENLKAFLDSVDNSSLNKLNENIDKDNIKEDFEDDLGNT
jgi:hypothetical protein